MRDDLPYCSSIDGLHPKKMEQRWPRIGALTAASYFKVASPPPAVDVTPAAAAAALFIP